ncbi:hypothetical protein ABPG74_016622 [Tetrahymena malaccensis]
MIQTFNLTAIICFVAAFSLTLLALIKVFWVKLFKNKEKLFRESINYHFTRQCNYACKFCFHTAKTSFVLDEENAKKGLKMLKESGMKKINFSGGEPFTKPTFLGNLVQYCKEKLNLESVTIVSNGSLITEEWFKNYGKWLDIIAISCDSFDEQALADIGRRANKKTHIEQMYKIRDWCYKYDVLFKINTVVTSRQYNEDMNTYIQELKPYRWKVFQCLLIDGENAGANALRNAEQMVVSKEQFDQFIFRHKASNPVAENNEDMKDSYLILDEQMRFLNCQNGKKEPSLSILDVGVEAALDKSGFDEKAFIRRGGKYVWSKHKNELEW